MRVVYIGHDLYEQRKATLTPRDHPWLFAAKRHLDWLRVELEN